MSKTGTVRANGQELYYEVHGEGQPLVLVMGIGYDSIPLDARAGSCTVSEVSGRHLRQPRCRPQLAGYQRVHDRGHGRRHGRADGRTRYPRRPTLWSVDGRNDRDGVRAPSPGSPGSDGPDRRVWSARARGLPSDHRPGTGSRPNDKTGEIFACQQFTWLFSTAFLRNRDAVQQTVAMLSSNPNPVGPQAYNRQAQAFLQFDVLDRLAP